MTVAIAFSLVAPVGARQRPYDAIMKDVGSTFGTLRKTLETGDLTATTSDAEKLARLFTEVEQFWVPFRTKDAIDAARGARDAAVAMAGAAKAKDAQAAKTAATRLAASCTACHLSHREQLPDKTYRIKP